MTRMPFGKHAGVDLTEIQRPYLRWLRGQQWVGGWLLKEIDDLLDCKVVTEPDKTFEELLQEMKESANG